MHDVAGDTGGGHLAGREVTVAGAGIAGLAVALALAQRGARVRVLEQAAELRAFGAGLQIGPNGAAVLRALGFGPAVEAAGRAAAAVELRDGASDRLVLRMALDGAGPWILIHRGALVERLAEAARAAGVAIGTGRRLAAVDLDGPRARLHLVDAAGGMIEEDAGLLIGADGVHSRVREAVDGVSAPWFTGQVAWRALVPAEPEAASVAEVRMGPGRHLVSYPMGGGLRNIVAIEERGAWVEENWAQPDDPAHLRAAFAGFGGPVPGWLAQVEEVHLWGLFRHPVAVVWHRGAGVLAGDAAHATLPFLAQGANMALEDAWVLAAALDRAPQAQALAAYQAARVARAARIVAAADANARNYHLRGPLRALAHGALRLAGAIAPRAPLARFDWLYRHDVTRD